ncbi:MAG: GatB/YqeY domain-containing protein [Firmicutes bacterium]|jgi:hypothetical protein|nr:GatB/YqeY domain-containing protein [Bacillota bacterium]
MEFKALQAEMIKALKAGQKERKESISLLVAAVKKAAIDAGCREEIPEDLVTQAILKEAKSAKEQVDTCPESRQDLLEKYKAHLAVVEEFAPKMMSAEEVEALLKEKYADVIATKNRGMIMKTVMADLKGKADGKVISGVVGELCK